MKTPEESMKSLPCSGVSVIDFEKVFTDWDAVPFAKWTWENPGYTKVSLCSWTVARSSPERRSHFSEPYQTEIKKKSNKENNKDKETNNEKEKPKLKNSVIKKTLILRDSIIKNVVVWRLNRRMKTIVSVRSISGAITKAMKHHAMGCLEDESPVTMLFLHGTNNLKWWISWEDCV